MADMQENEHYWLTMADACQTLKVSERTLHRHIKQGKYSSRMDNGRRLVCLTMAECDSQNQQSELSLLRQQLAERDRQIQTLTDDLRVSNQRHDTIVMQLTQQLDRAHIQIEDMRHRRPFWKRLFRQK